MKVRMQFQMSRGYHYDHIYWRRAGKWYFQSKPPKSIRHTPNM
jgi:hypothetical protein